LKTIILLFSIVLLVYPILAVEALNQTQGVSDCITSSECTTQNFIIEKQDKQIANLTDIMNNLTNKITTLQNSQNVNNIWKNIGTGFGIVGSIVGIIGGIYGIKRKREVSNSKLKTEQVKRSAYYSTKRAKDAEKNKHNIESGKKLWDWFTGK
jgi:hypothetical protein